MSSFYWRCCRVSCAPLLHKQNSNKDPLAPSDEWTLEMWHIVVLLRCFHSVHVQHSNLTNQWVLYLPCIFPVWKGTLLLNVCLLCVWISASPLLICAAHINNSEHKDEIAQEPMSERKDWIFKAHNSGGDGLYLIQLMSAAVLLICTEWGTTKHNHRHRARLAWTKQCETHLAPHLFYWSRTQSSYSYSPNHISAFCLTTGLEQLKTHISTPVCSLYIQFPMLGNQQIQKETNYWPPICLCLVSILTVGQAAATTDTIDIQKREHEGALILERYWKESVVPLNGTIAPFFSLL